MLLCRLILSQGSGTTKSKSNAAAKDRATSIADEFQKDRVTARLEINEHWTCDIHSLPDKPALCMKNPVTGLCHPITENNASFWAALMVYISNIQSSSQTNHSVYIG
jgi:hypothetical protein